MRFYDIFEGWKMYIHGSWQREGDPIKTLRLEKRFRYQEQLWQKKRRNILR